MRDGEAWENEWKLNLYIQVIETSEWFNVYYKVISKLNCWQPFDLIWERWNMFVYNLKEELLSRFKTHSVGYFSGKEQINF